MSYFVIFFSSLNVLVKNASDQISFEINDSISNIIITYSINISMSIKLM